MSKNVSIIASGMRTTFIELQQALSISLKELGFNVDSVTFNKQTEGKRSDINIFIMGIHNFDVELPKDSFNILYQLEGWHVNPMEGFDPNIKKWKIRDDYDLVLDLFKDFNDKYTVPHAVHCPLGYSPAFEGESRVTQEFRDFYFFGAIANVPMRRKLLNKYNNRIYYLKQGAFGTTRDDFIMGSRINLYLKAYNFYRYAPYHSLLVQCKKKFYMSEKAPSYEPFIPGKHFVEWTDIEECFEWLNRPKDREEFAEEAYKDLKENYNFTNFLETALKGKLL